MRTGDGDRRLTRYEVDRFKEMRGQPKYDLEPVLEATVEDLDASVLRAVAEQSRRRAPRFFGKMKDEEILVKLGALVKIGEELHPTLAGLLIAGMALCHFHRLSRHFEISEAGATLSLFGQ